ncbi:MAG: hypothetical protein IJO11_02935, partial [Alphaproteobacteria bacterium]|nr:hypothetical protein [Alphaproteobacteria bacterium]
MHKIKVQEIGRSMVEMLGVLAIIGILSIVGVAGYQYAMDKHVANDVLHEANLRGHDVKAHYQEQKLPDITVLGGYGKYTATGKPISVLPNPSDFNWAEYPEKCESAEVCQAFDVAVRGLTQRQCEIIMNSDWRMPDSTFVSLTGNDGVEDEANGDGEVAPIATTSATTRLPRISGRMDPRMCDFGDDEADITVKFRFVTPYINFAEDTTSSGGTSGTVPDDEEEEPTPENPSSSDEEDEVECMGGKVKDEDGNCECPDGLVDFNGTCKESCTGGKNFDSSGNCVCPANMTDINGMCHTNCTGGQEFDSNGTCICKSGNWNGFMCIECDESIEKWDESKKTCVCLNGLYGLNCDVECPSPREWNATNGCHCSKGNWNGSDCIVCDDTTQKWDESKKTCVCTTGYYGDNCEIECFPPREWNDGSQSCVCPEGHWNGQKCVVCDAETETWDYEKQVCICSNGMYGPNCDIVCEDPRWWNGTECVCKVGDWNGEECITCTEPKTVWNKTTKECECPAGTYGENCEECPSPRYWNTTNNACECPGNVKYNAEKNTCPDTDGSLSEGLCSEDEVWNGQQCVTRSCVEDEDCPDYYYCNPKNKRCETMICDKMGFKTRAFYCSTIVWDNDSFAPWLYVNRQYYTGSGDHTLVSGCRNSILVIPQDYVGSLYFGSCRVGYVVIDDVQYHLNSTYSISLKKGVHKISFWTPRNKGKEFCTINFHNAPGWDVCMNYISNCPAGYYCEPDALEPIDCPTAHYCPANSYFGPTDCPAGTWNDTTLLEAVNECKNCPEQYYCPVESIKPTFCPVGTYYPLTKAYQESQCLSCNINTATTGTTKEACHFCDNRYWRERDGACINCNYVTYYGNTSQEECFRCPKTFWRSYNNENYCFHCDTADAWAYTYRDECERCKNRFWVEHDATNHYGYCYRCPVGMVRDEETGICTCGEGQIYSRSSNTCVACEENSHFQSTEQSTETSCEAIRFYSDNQYSYLCSRTDQYPVTTKENCAFCGEKNVRYWRSYDKYCIHCDYSYTSATTQEECHTCDNRYWRSDNYCFNCNTVDYYGNTTKEECERCEKTFWRENGGYCFHCDTTNTWDTTYREECERCENRFWVEYNATSHYGYCYKCPTGMVRDEKTGICTCGNGQIYSRSASKCVPCEENGHFQSTEQSTEVSCEAIRFYANNEYSYLCSRPDEAPVTTEENCAFCGEDTRLWRSNDKACFSCDYSSYISTTTQEECFTCSNRYWRSHDKICINCDTVDYYGSTTKEECYRCENWFWRGHDNHCVHCNRTDTWGNTTETECERCENRFWVQTTAATETAEAKGNCYMCPVGMSRNEETGICGCEAGMVYSRSASKCVPCDQSGEFQSTEQSTEASCPTIRYYANNEHSYLCSRNDQYPATTKENCAFCGADTRFWRDSDDLCIHCNYGPETNATQEECHTCSNRFWRNTGSNQCMNCNTLTYYNSVTQDECYRCSNWFWRGSSSQCVHCDRTDSWGNTTRTECERCENRFWVETTAATETTEAQGTCYMCPVGMERDEKTGICVCEEGLVFSRSTNKCVPCDQAGEFLSTEQSTETSCSGERYYATNGYSYICTRIDQAPATTKENCAFCGEKDGRFWREYYKTCWDCDDNETVSWTKEADCEVCSNRYWVEHDATNHYGYCYLCPNGTKRDEKTGICVCEEGTIYNRSTNTCVPCEQTDRFVSTAESSSNSCAGIRYYANDTYSYLCSATTYAATTRENCVVCGEKNVRFWQSGNNNCVSCNHSYTNTTTQEECHMCDNRYWRTDNHCFNCDTVDGYNVITKEECNRCNNRFFRSYDGYCTHCDHSDRWGYTTEAECFVCPNRYWVEHDTTNHLGYCYKCPAGMTRDSVSGSCICENGKIINNSANTCVDCTLESNFASTQEANDSVCRGTRYYANNNNSYLCSRSDQYTATTKENCESCGADVRFWRDSDDYCIHCNYSYVSGTAKEECHMCSNRYWRNDNYCFNCDTVDYQGSLTVDECYRCDTKRFWRSSDGYCIHCDHASTHGTTLRAECEWCPNRYWVETNATNYTGDCYRCPEGMVRDETTGICRCEAGTIYSRSSNKCVSCEENGNFQSTEQSTETSCPMIRYYANNANSYLCQSSTYAATTRENCEFCGENVRFWQSSNNNCVSCNHSYTNSTKQEECHMCDNRYWRTDNYCFNCDTNDYQSGLSADECYRCPKRFWRSKDQYCIHCENTTTHNNSLRSECERCDNRYWVETTAATETSGALGNCYICPNGMKRDETTGICTCEAGTIYSRSSNTCVPCDQTDRLQSTEQSTNTSCYGIRYYSTDTYSYSCANNGQYPVTTEEECISCGDGVRFWRSNDKYCIHCDYSSYTTNVKKDECSRCENRYWVEHDATNHLGYCYKCPAGTVANSDHTGCQACPEEGKYWVSELNSGGNVCIACSPTTSYYSTVAECHTCDNQFATIRTDNRIACYGCNEGNYSYSAVNTTTVEECNRCPMRYLDSNKICKICPTGYYCERTEEGKDAIICPIGHYCEVGTDKPTVCPAGTYRTSTGGYLETHCSTCPQGYYCPTTEAAVVCPIGHYCPAGSTEPTICPKGTYRTGTGGYLETHCTACPAGKYCPTTEATVDCPIG